MPTPTGMDFIGAIRKAFRASSLPSLTVDGKAVEIFTDLAPENAVMPYIVLTDIGGTATARTSGATGSSRHIYTDVYVQVDIWCKHSIDEDARDTLRRIYSLFDSMLERPDTNLTMDAGSHGNAILVTERRTQEKITREDINEHRLMVTYMARMVSKYGDDGTESSSSSSDAVSSSSSSSSSGSSSSSSDSSVSQSSDSSSRSSDSSSS